MTRALETHEVGYTIDGEESRAMSDVETLIVLRGKLFIRKWEGRKQVKTPISDTDSLALIGSTRHCKFRVEFTAAKAIAILAAGRDGEAFESAISIGWAVSEAMIYQECSNTTARSNYIQNGIAGQICKHQAEGYYKYLMERPCRMAKEAMGAWRGHRAHFD